MLKNHLFSFENLVGYGQAMLITCVKTMGNHIANMWAKTNAYSHGYKLNTTTGQNLGFYTQNSNFLTSNTHVESTWINCYLTDVIYDLFTQYTSPITMTTIYKKQKEIVMEPGQ